MRRIILIAVSVICFTIAAAALPRAIGLRCGWGAEISYQHTLGGNFIEADLGLFGSNSLNIGATYNWMIAQPQWTDRGDWGIYAGPGAILGLGFGQESHFTAAVCGQVGVEYTFWFPLQLSLDIRPQFGLITSGKRLYFDGYYPALSIRYRF